LRQIEFKEKDEDSKLTVLLSKSKEGTELTLIHTNIPEGQPLYKQGWINHYFIRMKNYFESFK
jgi:hypothetical protein